MQTRTAEPDKNSWNQPSYVKAPGLWGSRVGKAKLHYPVKKVCSQIAKPEAITSSMVSMVLCMTVFRARVCASAYICRLEFIEHTDAEVCGTGDGLN